MIFALILAATRIGGIRGIEVCWVLVGLFWLMLGVNTLMDHPAHLDRAVQALPERFVAWSTLGVPIWIATLSAPHLFGGQRLSWKELPFPLAWTALLGAAAILSNYPPDVGDTPTQNPVVFASIAILLPFAPIALVGANLHLLDEWVGARRAER
jgi:hypothetical protein